MIDAYRIDNHTPACKRPYRLRINGQVLTDRRGAAKRFRSLAEACAIAAKVMPKK